MNGPLGLLTAAGAAGVAAAVALLIARLVPRAGSTLGVGLGLYAGVWVLKLWPAWPPGDVAGRWLLVAWPAAIAVECGCLFRRPWPLRGLIAAFTLPVLLFQTRYLADAGGPGSREWSIPTAVGVLAGAAFALAVATFSAVTLAERGRERAMTLAVAIANAGAGAAVMMSGYATGGALGVLIGAAMAGAAGTPRQSCSGPVSLGTLGLFFTCAAGLLFGGLRATHALALFTAPAWAWLGELSPRRSPRPAVRLLLCLGLAFLPIAVVVVSAWQDFRTAWHGGY